MKKITLILFTITISIANVKAQSAFSPNTGDTEMDGILNEVNTKAKNDPVGFSKDVATIFNIEQTKIDQVAKVMNPGDIYMAAQVASVSKKPFEEVTKAFQANKEKGWGVIAKEMGIKPGSAEFHEMKKNMKTNGNKGKGNENKEKSKGNKKNKGNQNGSNGKANGKGKNK